MLESLIPAAAAVLIVTILAVAGLRAWRGWLELRRLELDSRARQSEDEPVDDDVGVRIELAAVRERVKKLEAIASGVEL